MEKPKITILEQTSLPRILIYLKNHKKASRTELRDGIDASQQAIYRALGLLYGAKLIEELTPDGSPRRKDVKLTAKGQRISEALENMEELF